MKQTRQEYIDYVKFIVTGGRTHLEIPDETIGKYVDFSLQELRRYLDETQTITVPFAKTIDLTGFPVSSVIKVYRTEGYTGDNSEGITTSDIDPMYAQQWMAFSSGGTMYNLNNFVLNYLAYNTLLQMKSTLSTELNFREILHDRGRDPKNPTDKHLLYINSSYDTPTAITIEYVPAYDSVEQVTSDYWVDILKRLAVAHVKVALGRIRSKYTQNNALWSLDGETMLQEGNEELKELRETLRVNSAYMYPVD